jgi:hypothetical protein
MRIDAERKIPQDLGPEAIAQSYVLEPDHLPLPKKRAVRRDRRVAACLDPAL